MYAHTRNQRLWVGLAPGSHTASRLSGKNRVAAGTVLPAPSGLSTPACLLKLANVQVEGPLLSVAGLLHPRRHRGVLPGDEYPGSSFQAGGGDDDDVAPLQLQVQVP